VDAEHKSSRWRRVHALLDEVTPIFTAVMVLTVLFAAVYVIQGQSRVNRAMDCFASYTGAYDKAQIKRIAAAETLDAKELVSDKRKVEFAQSIVDVFDGASSQRIRRASVNLREAVAAVRDARQDLLDVRAANPLPDPCTGD
jgi:hypothetical protein